MWETKGIGTGYPIYIRSPEKGGRIAVIARNRQNNTNDDSWIIPYSSVVGE